MVSDVDQNHAAFVEIRCTASAAAFAVGYESASQFSREYKRLFGVSPIHDAKLKRG